jgi:hypothetical protein
LWPTSSLATLEIMDAFFDLLGLVVVVTMIGYIAGVH